MAGVAVAFLNGEEKNRGGMFQGGRGGCLGDCLVSCGRGIHDLCRSLLRVPAVIPTGWARGWTRGPAPDSCGRPAWRGVLRTASFVEHNERAPVFPMPCAALPLYPPCCRSAGPGPPPLAAPGRTVRPSVHTGACGGVGLHGRQAADALRAKAVVEPEIEAVGGVEVFVVDDDVDSRTAAASETLHSAIRREGSREA